MLFSPHDPCGAGATAGIFLDLTTRNFDGFSYLGGRLSQGVADLDNSIVVVGSESGRPDYDGTIFP